MSIATIFGICAACLVGLGLYGLIVQPQPLRKILAFNILGGGIFLLFGAVARRGAAAGMGGDPVPQALVITGIVVAFSATALGVAILLRLFDETGGTSLEDEPPRNPNRRRRIPDAAGSTRFAQNPGDFSCWPLHCPVAGILLVFLAGGRYARGITLALLVAGVGIAAGIAGGVWRTGDALTYLAGGWAPPLGIKLRADGLSAAMILGDIRRRFSPPVCMRRSEFRVPQGKPETRVSLSFWILLLSVWAAMNAVFLGNDLLQSLRRSGTRYLRRGAVGLPEWQPSDIDRRIALPAVCLDWVGALPAWSGLALWQLRHTRHRSVGCAGPSRTSSLAGDCA